MLRRGIGLLAVSWLTTGCQVLPSPTWQSIQATATRLSQPEASPVLRPEFEYLRVIARGQSNYLALGYREQHVAASGVPSQHNYWYSGHRELLVTVDGRLQEVFGLPVEWRGQSAPAMPTWAVIATASAPLAWTRSRDEMPGYRFAVRDDIVSERSASAPEDAPPDLALPPGAIWVRERVATTLPDGRPWSHSQWFALAPAAQGWSVLWSRQCLTPDWCLEISPASAPARS